MKKKLVLSIAVLLLAITVMTLFVACTPSVDAVANKFSNKGYTVTKSENEVIAGDPETDSSIKINWYDDDDEAQAAYDKALAVHSEKNVVKKGKAVAVGDEKAISLFK
ncbi:MAG: hypothetical protein K2G37_00680 [Clostridia bacterium]|nr:hypothetical protein [Clostridia bacterium]MDE7328562.1 hypothetical protein [Clostridia bacterium]